MSWSAGSPPKFNGERDILAPDVGQHTFDVLSEFGVTEDEVNELAANGVLG